MHDDDALCAFLDGELEPDARARIEAELERTPDARARLERLRAARDLVRGSAAPLSSAEAERLDAAVAAALDSSAVPRDAAVMTSGKGRPPSPRKRGRPPWPYFAAAAAVAVVLSIGLVLLAQAMGGRTSSSDIAGGPTETAGSGPAAVQREPSAASDLTGGSTASESAAPGADQGLAVPKTQQGPILVLSDVQVADTSGLAELLAVSPSVPTDREQAINELVALASGAGQGDLRPCLNGLADSVTPARVDAGTFAGAPAWFVSGGLRGQAATTVSVFGRTSCALTAAFPG